MQGQLHSARGLQPPQCARGVLRPHRLRRLQQQATASAAAPTIQAEDRWIAHNVVPLLGTSTAAGLAPLHESCRAALGSLRMPTMRNEEYRFTDLAPLLKARLVAPAGSAPIDRGLVEGLVFEQCAGSALVVVDGVLRLELSSLGDLPEEVYVGGVAGAPEESRAQLGSLSAAQGGPVSVLNGALAQDTLCVVVPPGVQVTVPLYVLHIATGSGASGASGTSSSSSSSSSGGVVTSSSSSGAEPVVQRSCCAPRLLVSLGADASLEMHEEFVSAPSAAPHFTCAVAELMLGEGAAAKHGYVEREAAGARGTGPGSVHMKVTLVRQAEGSSYKLVEARVGGGLSRHDVGVLQTGPDTFTELRHFLLCGAGQLHDLHSRLLLDHPRGEAAQLHKCIVSHSSGRGVFDGSVRVNRFAQKTDAQQLSRNLLLVPRATVNVKPNLQIVADDVKCTHGCAISDLSEEELFYFRARGINAEAARTALVYSFGAEVVQGLGHEALVGRVQTDVVGALRAVAEAHPAAGAATALAEAG